MSDQVSAKALLRRVPLFSGLGDRELAKIARVARERRYAAGEDIVKAGHG